MKKTLMVAVVAALAIAVVAAPASAFTFGFGRNLGKMSDYGSFLDPVTHAAKPVGSFAPGDLDITVFTMTDLYAPDVEINPNRYYVGTPELIGLFSDLQIGAVRTLRAPGVGDPGKFEVDLVAANRFAVAGSAYTGGRIDLWEDTNLNFTPAGAGNYPNDFALANTGALAAGWDAYPFDPGEYDTFPTATDGTAKPVLSGTLVAPVEGNPALLTLTLDFKDGTGATNQGYIHLLYNGSPSIFGANYLNGQAEIAFFNNFKFYPNNSIPYEPVFDRPNTAPIYWATSSQDPINFEIIPEPATLTLFGTGLAGLVGFLRRRSK